MSDGSHGSLPSRREPPRLWSGCQEWRFSVFGGLEALGTNFSAIGTAIHGGGDRVALDALGRSFGRSKLRIRFHLFDEIKLGLCCQVARAEGKVAGFVEVFSAWVAYDPPFFVRVVAAHAAASAVWVTCVMHVPAAMAPGLVGPPYR